jgi:hypothetical protein
MENHLPVPHRREELPVPYQQPQQPQQAQPVGWPQQQGELVPQQQQQYLPQGQMPYPVQQPMPQYLPQQGQPAPQNVYNIQANRYQLDSSTKIDDHSYRDNRICDQSIRVAHRQGKTKGLLAGFGLGCFATVLFFWWAESRPQKPVAVVPPPAEEVEQAGR